ncbi:MAG: NAD(P)/FAD-dependent oxidoreductase [Acidobacteriota bacterium]
MSKTVRGSGSDRGRPLRIAGAGPAGLTAAIVLARAGRAVEVHEARDRVGHRFIGDFQVLENSSEARDATELLQELGIEINFDFEPANDAVLFDHKLRARPVKSSRPYGYFLRRGPTDGTLDRGLLAQAQEAGAEIRFGSRLKPGDVDIAATGPAACDGLAREMTFNTTLSDRTWVLFDQRLAPGGYAYLFVRHGFATYGAAIVADFKSIDERYEACLRRFQEIESFVPQDARTAYSYMNFTLKSTASIGATLYAGEAAGFQDYLFGLGIRYAITSGGFAARALLNGSSFDELWEQGLQRKQRTSLVNRFLYERGGNFGLGLFTRLAARGDFDSYLAKWHRFALWKRLLFPFVERAWRRHTPCRHALPGHWCRPPQGKVEATQELGEIGGTRI